MSTAETRRQAEADDYNVRRYAFHIFFAYCCALYLVVGAAHFYDPELMLRVYYGHTEPLTAGGIYFARQTAALVLVMGFLTALAWASKSGPVRDLIIKAHLAHHFAVLVVDWISESEGFITASWQPAMFRHVVGVFLFSWC